MKKILLTIFILFILIQIPVNSNENVDIILVDDIKLYEEYGFKDISLIYKREALTSFDMPFIVSKTGNYNKLSKNDLSTEINYEKQKDLNIYNKRLININNSIIAENENYYVINYHMNCKASNESFKIDLIPSIKGNRYIEYEWWSSSWQYKTMITIQHEQVDEDLQDFPIRIYLNDGNANDSDILSNCQNDLDDIAFTDETETVQLPHEIEEYITGGVNDYVNIWVKTNLWSSNDTIIYCYYGNSEASNQEDAANVWDEHFTGVYHMNEDSGDCIDSTSNGNDMTYNGDLPTKTIFGIGNGQDLDGNGDTITIPSGVYSNNVMPMTFEAVISPDVTNVQQRVLTIAKQAAYEWYFELQSTGNYRTAFAGGSGTGYDNYSVNYDTNKHYVALKHGLNINYHFYTDDTLRYMKSTFTGANFNSAERGAFVGASWSGTSGYLNGQIDEIRFSNIERSANWIDVTNKVIMNDSSTFYEIGNSQSQPASPSVLPNATSFNPVNNSIDNNINQNFSCYVYDDDGDPITYTIEIVNELLKYSTSDTVYNSTIYYNFTNSMFYGWNYIVFINLTNDNVTYNNYFINYRTKIENENSIGDSMEITLGINFLGIILMLAIFLLGFWADQEEKKNIWKPILMFLDTPIALALALNYISNSIFSVGWWIGVILFCFAIILSMAGLYYGLNFGRR